MGRESRNALEEKVETDKNEVKWKAMWKPLEFLKLLMLEFHLYPKSGSQQGASVRGWL